MIDLTQRGETEELVREALDDSDDFIHFNAIMRSVTRDEVTRVYDVLEKLKSAGVVECDSTGRNWRLKDDHRKDP